MPNLRFTGRSISECVIDEDDDETHRTALSTDLVAVAHTDVYADADAIGGAVYGDGVVGVLVDVDDDDFTTLSEINEPQQLRASTAVAMAPPSYALTTTIDVDNLIDAIDATTTTTTAILTTTEATTNSSTSCSNGNRNRTNIGAVQTKIQGMQPQNEHQQQQQQQQEHSEQQSLERQVEPQNLLTAPSQIGVVGFGGAGAVGVGGDAGGSGSGSGDDKSQHLSDIDNESFNSIDFEAEITIAGMTGAMGAGGVAGSSANGSPTKSNAELITTTSSSISGDTAAAAAATAAAGDNAVGNKLSSSGDTIGSFFNNLISNAGELFFCAFFSLRVAAKSNDAAGVS